MNGFLKVLSATLCFVLATVFVVVILFLVAPWIINIINIDVIADAYASYVKWVGSLFNSGSAP